MGGVPGPLGWLRLPSGGRLYGRYDACLDLGALAAGAYVVRVDGGAAGVAVRRLTVVR